MADKSPTHTVIRAGWYKRVNGKLQALKIGTELYLGKDQGERSVKRGFVKAIEPAKAQAKVEPSPKAEASEPENADTEDEAQQEKPKRKYKKRKAKS